MVINGLDGATGRYLRPALSREQVGRVVANIDLAGELRQLLFDWSEKYVARDPYR
ncbi:MAG TPA: hypothetical protein VN851_19240 [Thermoanaerobaculia bacterium]|nr:hypothetical protein [Thermoanaerobaculia bacterium]